MTRRVDSSWDPGRDSSRDPGRDSSRDPSRDPGRDPGRDSSWDPSRDPGRDSSWDPGRAPVAFGRRAVPRLFAELQRPEAARRRRALSSLCDLMHDPERLVQTVRGGFLEQLKVLFGDEDPSVRTKTCELLHTLSAHCTGRRAVLSSSLLPPVSQLLDDSSCRTTVLRVLNLLGLLPAGARALLPLVPKLMLKLQEEQQEQQEEEEEVLLLSTLSSSSRLDPQPALDSDGVSVLGRKLSHRSAAVRRAAAAAMMSLSVCLEGKRRVCEEAVLPVLVGLLQDGDVEVQANAAGVVMYAVTTTAGKQLGLDLDLVPVLLRLLSKGAAAPDRKAVVVNSLRALTALAEAPPARRLLLHQLPLLVARGGAAEEDPDIWRAAQTAIRVVTWTP